MNHKIDLQPNEVEEIIAQYESIVRANKAIFNVATDKDGEVLFEVWDVARDLGYDLSDADHGLLADAAYDLKARLGAEIGLRL